MKKTLIIIILSAILGLANAQNEISNVRVQILDTIVVITYDLYIKADIEIFVSFNNGNVFMGPLNEVTGAVGKAIQPEKNKIVMWNVVKEIGYVDFPNSIIKVTANPIVEKTNIITKTAEYEPEMVFVKGGTFIMGCTSEQGKDCGKDEKPAHQVTLSDYYIGKYEVTQKQWKEVMGSYPSELYNTGCDDCPVSNVSWNEVQDFIKKLNQKTGKQYRLPTEAEWEYACRGGTASANYKYSGSNNIDEVAWYYGNYKSSKHGTKGTTHSVGTKNANELGIYDMTGNVYEWCSDWKGRYSNSSQTNPIGAYSGSSRVLRGGSWLNRAHDCRVSYRNNYVADGHYDSVGFRLALEHYLY